ncbi:MULTISPECIES: phosphatase PAP2 family protein [unclassified Enterococcus]|uniref:phosphatase PAP2 family protein n=1 Tax=unclassified Enterococcus TaxID=2608891 RepID=UPI0015553DD3|nr:MULTISPECIES: phosphatase PAP2 family protein [unclassified Enterococcus]MBS7578241.1 phosphatase PAP2 family protein [Enterococcus sp. MMGLQ5-2]MBS7585520.1 phosphatase PAP2 family protein [Enterococcus sp. MMGLQ5-1]NPD13379.1 phosphatase PAP2 family protein [Enterococcus sp. MMGLQ5-1]NPD38072.1 phosphatase PAP2 family protein [Enterococcus sp. MMGLQ5-2]
MTFIKEKKELTILTIIIILLFIGGIWDQQLSQALMNQNSYFATVFQNYGLIFAGIIIFMSTQIFIYFAIKSSLNIFAKSSIYILALAGGAYEVWQTVKYALYYTVSSLHNIKNDLPIGAANNDGSGALELPNWYGAALIIITILSVAIGSYFCNLWLKDKALVELQGLVWIGLGGIVAVFTANTIVDAMKDLWGRLRPYELQDDWSKYTSWLQINGANGHKSFPSGHSEQGWLALYLSLFVQATKQAKRQRVYLFACVFGCLMAYSRVRIGAHFLSDVTMGSTISILVIYAVSRLLNQRFDGTSLDV